MLCMYALILGNKQLFIIVQEKDLDENYLFISFSDLYLYMNKTENRKLLHNIEMDFGNNKKHGSKLIFIETRKH